MAFSPNSGLRSRLWCGVGRLLQDARYLTQTFEMDFISDEKRLDSWPGRSRNGSGKQRNHELRPERQPSGFITDMSNGDDSGAIVSME